MLPSMRSRRRLLWAFALLGPALGCGGRGSVSSDSDAARPADVGGNKIAVVVSTLNNPWFVVLADAAKSRCEELGHEAKVFDSQNDPATEASIFDDVIAAGYVAILLNATDSSGSIATVSRATERGIPVFCMDREINADDLAAAQILSDSYSGCVDLGQFFVESVGREGEYAELLGLLGDNNTRSRSEGFHSVVDRFEGLKMVAQQSAEFDRTKALAVTESILQAHPGIRAIFCGNDAMALGAVQAVAAAGATDRIQVFGFDGAEDAITAIGQGRMAATAMQFPKLMARRAAEYADEWLAGRRDFPQKTPVGVELVTAENVSEYAAYGAKE